MAGDVTFTPTIGDHVAGQRLWVASYWRRPLYRLISIFLAATVLLTAATIAHEVLRRGVPLGQAMIAHGWLLIAPLLLVLIGCAIWWSIPRQVARLVRQQPNLLTATRWRWTDDELEVTSAAGASRVSWAELYRWLYDPRTILITPQERLLLTFPRRHAPPDVAADLLETLRRHARIAKTR